MQRRDFNFLGFFSLSSFEVRVELSGGVQKSAKYECSADKQVGCYFSAKGLAAKG